MLIRVEEKDFTDAEQNSDVWRKRAVCWTNIARSMYDMRDWGIGPVFNKSLKKEGRAGVQGIIFGSEVHWQLSKLSACQITFLLLGTKEQLTHLRCFVGVNRQNLTEAEGAGLYQLRIWPLVCFKNEIWTLNNANYSFLQMWHWAWILAMPPVLHALVSFHAVKNLKGL